MCRSFPLFSTFRPPRGRRGGLLDRPSGRMGAWQLLHRFGPSSESGFRRQGPEELGWQGLDPLGRGIIPSPAQATPSTRGSPDSRFAHSMRAPRSTAGQPCPRHPAQVTNPRSIPSGEAFISCHCDERSPQQPPAPARPRSDYSPRRYSTKSSSAAGARWDVVPWRSSGFWVVRTSRRVAADPSWR